jgi:hypothetical protein
MIGAEAPNFVDEIDCGSFFDQIDDFLDFPAVEDSVDAVLPPSDSFPSIWQTQPDSFAASDLSAELSVPYEDIVHLEWLSTFCEDSFSGGGLTVKTEDSFYGRNLALKTEDSFSGRSLALKTKDSFSGRSLTVKTEDSTITTDKDSLSGNQFRTSSPVSVLESSSSCSVEKTLPLLSPDHTPAPAGKRGRPRSKRPRAATFSPRPPIQLMVSPSSSITTETTTQNFTVPDSESFAESRLVIKIPKLVVPDQEHKKKIKKIRLSLPRCPDVSTHNSAGVRKCTHCEITETPQWRAGPNGPKTLCNACGVRYKSGRLFPEYRPAASPTFIPSVHSNSHRKVAEMRNKVAVVGTMMHNNLPELIPSNSSNVGLNYI